MESNINKRLSGNFSKNLLVLEGQNKKGLQSLTDSFTVLGDVLQKPSQFFSEIRDSVNLSQKITGLTSLSLIFLFIYGAVLGSGHPLLSLNAAIAVPLLFLGSLITCVPVIYLFDILSGSQRSLAQMVAILLTSVSTATTVFFCFSPIMVLFRLAGSLLQYFWLNVGILAVATLIGLIYVTEGLIKTANVDSSRSLSKVNQWLHFVWMLLYLMVISQMAWGLLVFFQTSSGGLLGLLF